MKPIIQLDVQDGDDPQFLKIVAAVTNQLLRRDAPQEAYIIRVNKWFDRKWRGFSGIGIVPFDFAVLHISCALDEFRQDQTTFPAFTPNRILDEHHFFRVGAGDYFEAVPEKFVHRSWPRRSSANLHRRVADFSSSGMFVWFNSQRQISRRGSLMVYTVQGHEVQTWFASFERSSTWKLAQTEGIAREKVQTLIERATI